MVFYIPTRMASGRVSLVKRSWSARSRTGHQTQTTRTRHVVLLDFSKAFDKVSHRKLLHKIDFYGIRGKTKAWISGFLDHRLQRVPVNGKVSSSTDMLSGVPQGTVLGQLLFHLYINDAHKPCVQRDNIPSGACCSAGWHKHDTWLG